MPASGFGVAPAAAAVASAALGHDQTLFYDRLSVAPSRIAGLDRQGIAVEPGSPANLMLFDPGARWIPKSFASKSENSPFRGMELTGKVMATIYEGRISYEDGLG